MAVSPHIMVRLNYMTSTQGHILSCRDQLLTQDMN